MTQPAGAQIGDERMIPATSGVLQIIQQKTGEMA
jgi:hypothetical protein